MLESLSLVSSRQVGKEVVVDKAVVVTVLDVVVPMVVAPNSIANMKKDK